MVPEYGLYFDSPTPEPVAVESGVLEIAGASAATVALAVEAIEDSALHSAGMIDPKLVDEPATPPADESREGTGGVWLLLSRLCAIAHGAVRKLADGVARVL